MSMLDAAQAIAVQLMRVENSEELEAALQQACERIGCRFFALSHHVDFLSSPGKGLRIHNYPEAWADWFDSRRLGVSDPVHRASQRTAAGFVWRDVPRFIRLRPADKAVFVHAGRHGIGDGLTIPAHVPGDAHGSCSFAWPRGEELPYEALAFAQSVGSFAFEAARRLHGPVPRERPKLTERQRECVLWVARGKTDWEISRIMGLRHFTVVEHLKNARDRYEAATRVTLTVRALFDGTLHFADIAGS
ncbi:MAG: LuxR family transcriptional regulator [Sphingopyxis sp.]|nr:LuxR family transcriptional regulator [Sphingopyxis sp.]